MRKLQKSTKIANNTEIANNTKITEYQKTVKPAKPRKSLKPSKKTKKSEIAHNRKKKWNQKWTKKISRWVGSGSRPMGWPVAV